jgi:hypothetical protein
MSFRLTRLRKAGEETGSMLYLLFRGAAGLRVFFPILKTILYRGQQLLIHYQNFHLFFPPRLPFLTIVPTAGFSLLCCLHYIRTYLTELHRPLSMC